MVSKDNEFELKPEVGKKFNTWEEAWKFWNNYGGKIRFNVRTQYFNKSKEGMVFSGRYVCSKEVVRKIDKREHLITNH